MRLSEIKSLARKNDKAVSIATASVITAFGLYKASVATTVVAGPVAAAGAIKTATVTTASGQTVVLSLVKAPLFVKALTVLGFVIIGTAVGSLVYQYLKDN